MTVYMPVPTEEEYEIAAKNGISKEVVYQRIHYRGKTVEQAITEPLQNGLFLKKYQKYIEIAERNGISYRTFHARMTKKQFANGHLKMRQLSLLKELGE